MVISLSVDFLTQFLSLCIQRTSNLFKVTEFGWFIEDFETGYLVRCFILNKISPSDQYRDYSHLIVSSNATYAIEFYY